ncbi:hypothetical protein ABPG75_000074 [Micractinium tetrahymenae]
MTASNRRAAVHGAAAPKVTTKGFIWSSLFINDRPAEEYPSRKISSTRRGALISRCIDCGQNSSDIVGAVLVGFCAGAATVCVVVLARSVRSLRFQQYYVLKPASKWSLFW